MALLESVTVQTARAVLDAHWVRHQVLAENIANHRSEGFQAKEVRFDAFLKDVREALVGDRKPVALQAPEISLRANRGVALDSEISELVKNQMQYEALLTALGRFGALNRIAIQGSQS